MDHKSYDPLPEGTTRISSASPEAHDFRPFLENYIRTAVIEEEAIWQEDEERRMRGEPSMHLPRRQDFPISLETQSNIIHSAPSKPYLDDGDTERTARELRQVVTNAIDAAPEPTAEDILQSMRAFKDLRDELDDEPVYVGTVDGEAHFWPRRLARQMDALWEPRIERRKA